MIVETLFNLINAEPTECIAPMKGTVINHYVLKNCFACNKLSPVVDELLTKIEKENMGIKYRKVVCNDCDCDGIKAFPTIEITKDLTPVSKTVGFKPYNEIAKWVEKSLQIESNSLVEESVEQDADGLKKLTSKDFLRGFNGEWVILFYKDRKDPLRKVFVELAQENPELNVAEVHESEVKDIESRLNISSYPHISGFNAGSFVPFMGDYKAEDFHSKLDKFIDILHKDTFEPITMEELKKLSETKRMGEPTYVVLYKDYETAAFYFRTLAQQFKFKADIYRSDDPKIFNQASFEPHEKHDEHDQMVRLYVYKNGTFYPCPYSLENNSDIVQWIFHTHFPHVVNLDNENFYSVFHGIKPVILLVSPQNDALLSAYERVSADKHLGTPYTNTLFVYLNTTEYPAFKNAVLKNLKEPSIVVFDPFTTTWYHKPMEINTNTIKKGVLNAIEGFYTQKLPVYPSRGSKSKFYIIAAIVISIVCAVVKKMNTKRKEKLSFYE